MAAGRSGRPDWAGFCRLCAVVFGRYRTGLEITGGNVGRMVWFPAAKVGKIALTKTTGYVKMTLIS